MKKYLDGCKTGNTRFDGHEAIKAIKRAGGIVVWAHPLGGEGEEHITKELLYSRLEKMRGFGIDGIECHYSRYSPEEVEFLVKTANEHELFISGGSDYHGTNKNIPLGRMNTEDKEIDASNLTILKSQLFG